MDSLYKRKSYYIDWMIWGYPYFRKSPLMGISYGDIKASSRGMLSDWISLDRRDTGEETMRGFHAPRIMFIFGVTLKDIRSPQRNIG